MALERKENRIRFLSRATNIVVAKLSVVNADWEFADNWFCLHLLDHRCEPLELFNGTAGVSPASSSEFTQGKAESFNPDDLVFNGGGRDARGPSEELEWCLCVPCSAL